jgi:molybdate transport system substrate-binding protein
MHIPSAGFLRTLLTAIWATCALPAAADTLRIATASNFAVPMKELASRFQEISGDRVLVSPGSTGKHYAQIRNGAPFDAFFAADTERPQRLEEEGWTIPGSRFTYALGRLVLWSPREAYVDPEGGILRSGQFRHLSLANPKLAPYGHAARQVLLKLGLWDALTPRMVRGENVGQTYQFVVSGSAELGFVARSQITRPETPISGSFWAVPEALYDPIEQQAVQLSERPSVRRFMEFVRSAAGSAVIESYGYRLPAPVENDGGG